MSFNPIIMGSSPSQGQNSQQSINDPTLTIMNRPPNIHSMGRPPITFVKAFVYAQAQNIPNYLMRCDLSSFAETKRTIKGIAVKKSTNTIFAWHNGNLMKISHDGEISEIPLTWTGIETLDSAPWNNLGCAFDYSRNKLITAHTSDHFISEIDPDEKTIRCIAGQPRRNGLHGNCDGHSSQAKFSFPKGIHLDSKRNLWICDLHSIRKMNIEDDIVSTFAGGNQGSTNGSCKEARFNSVWGLDFDETEKFMYVLDTGNRAIRKIDMEKNEVSTFVSNLPMNCRSLKVTPRSIIVTAEGLIQRVDLHTQEISIIASSAQQKDSSLPIKIPCNIVRLSYGPLIIADADVLLKLTFGKCETNFV